MEFYGQLPPLERLIKNSKERYSGNSQLTEQADFVSKEWSPLLQLVAIKGYGFRALAEADKSSNFESNIKDTISSSLPQSEKFTENDVAVDDIAYNEDDAGTFVPRCNPFLS